MINIQINLSGSISSYLEFESPTLIDNFQLEEYMYTSYRASSSSRLHKISKLFSDGKRHRPGHTGMPWLDSRRGWMWYRSRMYANFGTQLCNSKTHSAEHYIQLGPINIQDFSEFAWMVQTCFVASASTWIDNDAVHVSRLLVPALWHKYVT
jgi:hypothetical protein